MSDTTQRKREREKRTMQIKNTIFDSNKKKNQINTYNVYKCVEKPTKQTTCSVIPRVRFSSLGLKKRHNRFCAIQKCVCLHFIPSDRFRTPCVCIEIKESPNLFIKSKPFLPYNLEKFLTKNI